MLLVVTSVHPDKVALDRAARVLQHPAKFLAVAEDQEVDVEFLRRAFVVGDLTGAVGVNNGLPFIDGGDYNTTETLRSVALEETGRITSTGP